MNDIEALIVRLQQEERSLAASGGPLGALEAMRDARVALALLLAKTEPGGDTISSDALLTVYFDKLAAEAA